MSCPFPQYIRTSKDGCCVAYDCPAAEDCSGMPETATEPFHVARPFYVILIGPLTDDPVGYLGNVRRFCELAGRLTLAGYCPLNPAGDLLEVLIEPRLSVAVLRRRTRQMIELAAAAPRRAALCLGTENARGERSTGVAVELDDCRVLGVPVVWSESDLHAMRGT